MKYERLVVFVIAGVARHDVRGRGRVGGALVVWPMLPSLQHSGLGLANGRVLIDGA